MILLQVDLTSSDEFKTVYKGFYEIEDVSIFAWSSILTLDIIVGCMVQFVDYLLTTRQIT
jgi:hypothetical protein